MGETMMPRAEAVVTDDAVTGNAHKSATNAIVSLLPATTRAQAVGDGVNPVPSLLSAAAFVTAPLASTLATSSGAHGCIKMEEMDDALSFSARADVEKERGPGSERRDCEETETSAKRFSVDSSFESVRIRLVLTVPVTLGVPLGVTVMLGVLEALSVVDVVAEDVIVAVGVGEVLVVPLAVLVNVTVDELVPLGVREGVTLGVVLIVTHAVGDRVPLPVDVTEVVFEDEGVGDTVTVTFADPVRDGVNVRDADCVLLLLFVELAVDDGVVDAVGVGVADAVPDDVAVADGVTGALTVLLALAGGVVDGVTDGLEPIDRLDVGLAVILIVLLPDCDSDNVDVELGDDVSDDVPVAVAVPLGVGVGVADGDAELLRVELPLAVLEGLAPRLSVDVGEVEGVVLPLTVVEPVGDAVRDEVGVGVGVGVFVVLALMVDVGEGVCVGEFELLAPGESVGVGVGVLDGGVPVTDGLAPADSEDVGVGDDESVTVPVADVDPEEVVDEVSVSVPFTTVKVPHALASGKLDAEVFEETEGTSDGIVDAVDTTLAVSETMLLTESVAVWLNTAVSVTVVEALEEGVVRSDVELERDTRAERDADGERDGDTDVLMLKGCVGESFDVSELRCEREGVSVCEPWIEALVDAVTLGLSVDEDEPRGDCVLVALATFVLLVVVVTHCDTGAVRLIDALALDVDDGVLTSDASDEREGEREVDAEGEAVEEMDVELDSVDTAELDAFDEVRGVKLDTDVVDTDDVAEMETEGDADRIADKVVFAVRVDEREAAAVKEDDAEHDADVEAPPEVLGDTLAVAKGVADALAGAVLEVSNDALPEMLPLPLELAVTTDVCENDELPVDVTELTAETEMVADAGSVGSDDADCAALVDGELLGLALPVFLTSDDVPELVMLDVTLTRLVGDVLDD